jgi:hypothetical protein
MRGWHIGRETSQFGPVYFYVKPLFSVIQFGQKKKMELLEAMKIKQPAGPIFKSSLISHGFIQQIPHL